MEEIRINAKNLSPYRIVDGKCKRADIKLPDAHSAIKLFKSHRNFKYLIDQKDPRFLKGSLTDGKCKGARINILPDGRKLDKAYSLFAENLVIHDETSNDHWDVLFQNPGGTFSYVYTLDKKAVHKKQKYRAVHQFEKLYPKLKRNVSLALKDNEDHLALPMFTLLKTYMRIGNEIYYKTHGHKGLTTLKKQDVSMRGSRIEFAYLSKSGIPLNIVERFPNSYLNRLTATIKPLKKDSFIFTGAHGGILHDNHFKDAFKRYCGKEFYPHIVRSYFATKTAKEFLRAHRKPSKKDVRDLFMGIAEKLGHRRFDKKTMSWKESYGVTIHYYIQPEVLEKIQSRTK